MRNHHLLAVIGLFTLLASGLLFYILSYTSTPKPRIFAETASNSCTGSLTYTCGPYPNNKLTARWKVNDQYGGCNVYIRDATGDHVISTDCEGSWEGTQIPGSGTVTDDGRYKLFVSNGGDCLNEEKQSIALQCQEKNSAQLQASGQCYNNLPAIFVSYLPPADATSSYIFFNPSIGEFILPQRGKVPVKFYNGAFPGINQNVQADTEYEIYIADAQTHAKTDSVTVRTPKSCDKSSLPPLANPEPLPSRCGETDNEDKAKQYAIELKWKPVKGSVGYAIRIDEDPVTWNPNKPLSGDTIDNVTLDQEDATTFVAIAKPGKTYSWWVHSINLEGVYSINPTHVKYVCPDAKAIEEEVARFGAGSLIHFP